jgi:hypothetical protein
MAPRKPSTNLVLRSSKPPLRKTARKPNRWLNDQFSVLIQCDSEQQQLALLERFIAEGLKCRSLIA